MTETGKMGMTGTRSNQPGYFITFEGGEGTGKSTQMQRVAEHYRVRHNDVVVTREPGGTPLAEGGRALLLDPSYAPSVVSELFILQFARRDHTEKLILPALQRGAIVLSDRYADSSRIYQGVVGGLGLEVVEPIIALATCGLEPDLTVLLDGDLSCLDRARTRGAVGENRIDDLDSRFHERVYEGFRQLAAMHPDRFRTISALATPDEVFARILECLPNF